MSLHNTEYHAFISMRREFTEMVKNFLANNEVYQRIMSYIKIANDNLDTFHEALCEFNYNYKSYKLVEVSFRKESLLNSCLYEIELTFINDLGNRDYTTFGVDSFIIFLDAAGLVEN